VKLRTSLGEALIGEGRAVEAVPVLEVALAESRDDESRAQAGLDLGRALGKSDPARARPVFGAAAPAAGKMGDDGKTILEEIAKQRASAETPLTARPAAASSTPR